MPQMKRDKHGGVDWVETQKLVLQKMMLERLNWERTYKGSNPRGNLELSDYRREKAEEMAKEAELELHEVKQELTDKKNEVETQVTVLKALQTDADEVIRKANLAEELIEYFRNTSVSEREHEYFEKMLDLTYENNKLKSENVALKQENQTLKAKLQQAYDFMKQFTIGGMNMLEKFLRSIGEWVQQKVAGLSR